jgi:hypothetical protein
MWLDDFSYVYILAGIPELSQLNALDPYYLANAYPYEKYSIVGKAILETCTPEEFAAIPHTFRAFPDGYNGQSDAILTYLKYKDSYTFTPRPLHFATQDQAFSFAQYFKFRKGMCFVEYCFPIVIVIFGCTGVFYTFLVYLYLQH